MTKVPKIVASHAIQLPLEEESPEKRIEQLDGQLQLVGTLLEEMLSNPPQDGRYVVRKEVADKLNLTTKPAEASVFCTRGTFSYFKACCTKSCRVTIGIELDTGPTD